jgi:hypothetical protein
MTTLSERAAIIAYLDRMKVEAAELGQSDAVFWIVQIKRDIERCEHLAPRTTHEAQEKVG